MIVITLKQNSSSTDKVFGAFACLLFLLFSVPLFSQNRANELLELQEGDRVVFVGNSLFENDLPFGYLEFALTSRWPNRHVTFRNIGWIGDTVWGDARSYYTNPPTPYELLMEQLTKANPTVVVVAYGGIESQEGEAGLPRFTEGLNKLLDKIQELGAKAVLLSPIPQFGAPSPEKLAQRNTNLELYASTIATTAAKRNAKYVDVFKPLQEISKKERISDNNVHLNELGYYHLAVALEKGLGYEERSHLLEINLTKNGVETKAPVQKGSWDARQSSLSFGVAEPVLPLPLPTLQKDDKALTVKIAGLKKGIYALTIDSIQVMAASAKEWEKGIVIKHTPSLEQAQKLRELIVQKNGLFFQQYRPLNRTYIIGFRKYEQGRHVQGLEDLSHIIRWIESQVSLVRVPQPHTYGLILLK